MIVTALARSATASRIAACWSRGRRPRSPSSAGSLAHPTPRSAEQPVPLVAVSGGRVGEHAGERAPELSLACRESDGGRASQGAPRGPGARRDGRRALRREPSRSRRGAPRRSLDSASSDGRAARRVGGQPVVERREQRARRARIGAAAASTACGLRRPRRAIRRRSRRGRRPLAAARAGVGDARSAAVQPSLTREASWPEHASRSYSTTIDGGQATLPRSTPRSVARRPCPSAATRCRSRCRPRPAARQVGDRVVVGAGVGLGATRRVRIRRVGRRAPVPGSLAAVDREVARSRRPCRGRAGCPACAVRERIGVGVGEREGLVGSEREPRRASRWRTAGAAVPSTRIEAMIIGSMPMATARPTTASSCRVRMPPGRGEREVVGGEQARRGPGGAVSGRRRSSAGASVPGVPDERPDPRGLIARRREGRDERSAPQLRAVELRRRCGGMRDR